MSHNRLHLSVGPWLVGIQQVVRRRKRCVRYVGCLLGLLHLVLLVPERFLLCGQQGALSVAALGDLPRINLLPELTFGATIWDRVALIHERRERTISYSTIVDAIVLYFIYMF